MPGVFERLYTQGQDRLKKITKTHQQRQLQTDANCTFAPVTNHTSSRVSVARQSSAAAGLAPTPRPAPARPPITLAVASIHDILTAAVSSVAIAAEGPDKAPATPAQYAAELDKRLAEENLRRQNAEKEAAAAAEKQWNADEAERIKSLQSSRRPKQAKRTDADGGSRGKDRFGQLYADAEEKRKRSEIARAARAKELPAECTFSPRINRHGGEGSEHTAARDKAKLFENLYSGAQAALEKREAAYKAALKQRPRDCTFAPRINKKKGGQQADNGKKETRFLRLYKDGEKKRKERQEEIRRRALQVERQRREDEMVVVDRRDLDSSSGRRMNKRRSRAAAEAADGPEVHSEDGSPAEKARKPKPRSKVAAASKQKQRAKAVAKRKTGAGGRNKTRVQARVPSSYSKRNISRYREELSYVRQQEECTFSPKINRGKRGAAAAGGETDSVFARLNASSKARQQRILAREAQAPTGCTFKPSITARKTGATAEEERGRRRFERLYRDHEKRLARHTASSSKLPDGCTFMPDVTRSKGSMNGVLAEDKPRQPTRPAKGVAKSNRHGGKARPMSNGTTLQPQQQQQQQQQQQPSQQPQQPVSVSAHPTAAPEAAKGKTPEAETTTTPSLAAGVAARASSKINETATTRPVPSHATAQPANAVAATKPAVPTRTPQESKAAAASANGPKAAQTLEPKQTLSAAAAASKPMAAKTQQPAVGGKTAEPAKIPQPEPLAANKPLGTSEPMKNPQLAPATSKAPAGKVKSAESPQPPPPASMPPGKAEPAKRPQPPPPAGKPPGKTEPAKRPQPPPPPGKPPEHTGASLETKKDEGTKKKKKKKKEKKKKKPPPPPRKNPD